MKVFKYPLIIANSQWLTLPSGSQILSVGEQVGQLVLWAMVDPENTNEPRKILVRGTGQPFDGTEGRFIDTVQAANGLVWHIFEGK